MKTPSNIHLTKMLPKTLHMSENVPDVPHTPGSGAA